MSNKKQNSIDWLEQQLKSIIEQGNIEVENLIWKQAKQMHKDEIVDAYVYGAAYQIDIKNGLTPIVYYNETYGGQDESK